MKLDRLYCSVYLSTDLSESLIFDLFKGALNAKAENFSIHYHGVSISILSNDDFDIQKSNEFPDGFLYFRYIIEIEPALNFKVDEAHFIKILSEILSLLWKKKIPAVAACNFEDFLPEKGGYKSRNIPWPNNEIRSKQPL